MSHSLLRLPRAAVIGAALILTALTIPAAGFEKTADGYVVEKNGNPDAKADPTAKERGAAAAKAADVVKAQAAAKGTDPASAARRIMANQRQEAEQRAADAARRAAEQARPQVRPRGGILNQDDPNQNLVTARLQTLGKKEIFFIHKACGLNAEEKKKLTEALDQEIKSMTDPQANNAGRRDGVAQQREDIAFMNGVQMRFPAGAYERIPASVLRTARMILPTEKRIKLEEEIDLRKKFRREGSVMGAILGIDREVSLTPEQREKLVEVLTTKWDDSWGAPPEMNLQNNIAVPPIPSRAMEGVLTDAQLKIWQSLPKSRTAYHTSTLNAAQEMMSEDYDF